MRTETVNIYRIEDMDAEQFERAHRKWNDRTTEIPWMDETVDSLKAVFERCHGVKLKDWSIGAYYQGCFVKVEFSQDGAEDLTGARALAWLENNLFGALRAPWGLPKLAPGAPVPKGYYRHGEYENGSYFATSFGKVTRYTLPGAVPSCPLTGYAMDEDFLDALVKNVKAGDTLKDAFRDLADVARVQLESEDEYQRTADAFRETCEANGYEFDESGDLI